MSFYFVATLKMKIGGLWMEPQIDTVAVFSNDVLGTRILRVTSLHQFLHLLNVERRHNFRKRHVLRDTTRNSDLIDS